MPLLQPVTTIVLPERFRISLAVHFWVQIQNLLDPRLRYLSVAESGQESANLAVNSGTKGSNSLCSATESLSLRILRLNRRIACPSGRICDRDTETVALSVL